MLKPVDVAGPIVLTVMVREKKIAFVKGKPLFLNVTCTQNLPFGATVFCTLLKIKVFIGIEGSLKNL